MIIKPTISMRIFSGLAGFTLFLTGCSLSAVAFPVGLLVLCIALPLGIFSLAHAFGAVFIRVNEDGIFQRNFFLLSKNFKWNEIERGEAYITSYNYKTSSGWTERRTKSMILFEKESKRINIDGKLYTCEEEGWWPKVIGMAKEKMGDTFVDKR